MLPQLKQDEKTLYIIGNGFDLHHHIKSTYGDFYNWLNANGHKDFVDDMEMMFPELNNPQGLWSNYEKILGGYDERWIYDKFRIVPNDFGNKKEWELTNKRIAGVCSQIRPLMKEWAQSISLDTVQQSLPLHPQSLYLTFNYTRILEDIYGIPTEQICHIHGSVSDAEELIVGHHSTELRVNHYSKSDEEDYVMAYIAKLMTSLDKHPNRQIEKYIAFFHKIQEVKYIVTLGHSMSQMDWRYFGKILKDVPPSTHWYFSWHSPADEKCIRAFLNRPDVRGVIKPIQQEFFNF